MKLYMPILTLAALAGLGWYIGGSALVPTQPALERDSAAVLATTLSVRMSNARTTQKTLTHDQLLALADDSYEDGELPLGDYRYVTVSAKKGFVYLCNARKDNAGAMNAGPWIHTKTWNDIEKISVDGDVLWSDASFSNTISGATRTLSGNALPLTHTTGMFPVQRADPAAQYDRNPNSISAQTLLKNLPANPVYSETPYCMGGEVGVMLTGVPLFNAFDAGLRDAAAHEVQDGCDGHPQQSGMYHYHSLSSCIQDTDVDTVIGYANDGFPITGPKVAEGKFLTTDDLDECHGITSEIMIDGVRKISYHYVMTRDFPYSASCFRGKPIQTARGADVRISANQNATQSQPPLQNQQTGAEGPQGGTPPQEAIDACTGRRENQYCSFTGMRGEEVAGSCRMPPGMQRMVCVPTR